MDNCALTPNYQINKPPHFKIENILNHSTTIQCIATACENQCIRCNVNSQKLGRTRS